MGYGYPVQSPLCSMTFHDVIVFRCCSLYFNTLLARYREVNDQIKKNVYMNIKFDELFDSKIDSVLQKKGEYN